MERIDNIGFDNLQLLQDDGQFCFGIDAVILADFACRHAQQAGRVVDLCTGNGVVPLIMSHKNKSCSLTGIDVQEGAIGLARRTAEMNGLGGRLSFLHADVKDLADRHPELKMSCDLVTCNPPYVARQSGLTNERDSMFIARHETTAGMEDFIRAAAWLLDDRGHFCMVHRPSRLVDLIWYCRKYKLEPKDIRFVSPKEGAIPNILLLHCVKGGGKQLKYEPNLNVYNDDGSYTDEIEHIYERA